MRFPYTRGLDRWDGSLGSMSLRSYSDWKTGLHSDKGLRVSLPAITCFQYVLIAVVVLLNPTEWHCQYHVALTENMSR